jgi:hypothetical protein
LFEGFSLESLWALFFDSLYYSRGLEEIDYREVFTYRDASNK